MRQISFKSMFPIAMGLSIFVGSTALFAADEKNPSVSEILKKSVQAIYAKNEESTYVMKLIAANGSESIRKMKIWFKSKTEDDARLLLRFLEPADIRGTAMLSIVDKGKEPDQWLYLPAMKKSRRVKGGNKSESFLGSDFSMADLTIEKGGDQLEYVVEGSEKCGDADCFKIVGTPKKDADKENLTYSKRVLLVRKDNYMVPKTEFYNMEGALEKVMTLKGIHKEGARWIVDEMEMENVQSKHKTVIQVEKRDSTKVPADSVFTPNYLERG